MVASAAVEKESELKQEALTVVQRATLVKITDQTSYDSAAVLLTECIKPMRARWKEYWETLREPAYRAYQGIMTKFNDGDKPLEQAERVVKQAISAWDIEQERIRQELQRKAQEEAEDAEAEARLRAAIVAEQSGASEQEVTAIVETPVMVVAPPVEPVYVKASGISRRANWKAKVVDFKALVKAVAAGKVPLEYLLPNDAALNARAKADKGTLNIAGVIAYDDPVVSGRSR